MLNRALSGSSIAFHFHAAEERMDSYVQLNGLLDGGTLHIRVAPPTSLKCRSNALLQGRTPGNYEKVSAAAHAV